MLESKARWSIGKSESPLAEQLVRELELDPLVARLLVLRGIHSLEQAHLFLYGGKEHFHDPFLLDGMGRAVERIRQALDKREKIRIYGDYDADGVSSTSLMIFLMRHLGADFDYYIPHRMREGYGLNEGAIDHAREHGVSLIITVDTGISAVEQVAYIQQSGMDVIVTDHHEPPEVLPEAYAVINPKKPGCPYPFKQLAGVGVALKLAHALLGRLPEELLEIAAIGTVADLMPLVDENRLIVKLGLERMKSTEYAGIKALLDVAGIDRKEVNATHIGFAVGPRINASGRLECADTAVRLLTTADETEARQLAYGLNELNKERQRIVDEITKQALEMAAEQKELGLDKVIVLSREDWNVGVIGIVASKVLEKFYRPTIILSIDPATGMAKGSARSIAGFDIYQALTRCSEWLDHYGGHQAAAGMSLHRDHIDAFARKLNELAGEWLTEADFVPILKADAECGLSDISLATIRQLEQLAPYGIGNPTPRFVFTGLGLEELRAIGKEKQHLKLSLSQASAEAVCTMEAVGFGKGTLIDVISPTARVDVLGELGINEWNGVRKPQIIVQDLRIPHLQVYDWRGTAVRAEEKIRSLSAAGFEPAILLFDPADRKALPSALASELPVWAHDPSTSLLKPMNQAAENLRFTDAKDLILYSIPGSVQDLRGILQQALGMQRCYALFRETNPLASGTLPSRESFKAIYVAVQQQVNLDSGNNALINGLSKRSGLSPAMVRFVLEVFEELGFVKREGTVYQSVPAPGKKELTASSLYRRRMHRTEVEEVCVYSSAKELEQWIAKNVQQASVQTSANAWEEAI